MTKRELINILKNVDDNADIYIYCSYNSYNIRHLVKLDEFVILNVGDVVNPEIIDDTPMVT